MSDILLETRGLRAGYGHAAVLHGVDFEVRAGEIVSLIGSNGAGKSTLLKSIVGLVRPSRGSVSYRGADITGGRPDRLVRDGLALVPEGRMLFGPLTVAENLELGAYSARSRSTAVKAGRERVARLFPILMERAGQPAATLSGGEQQMLAIGRALMSGPSVLLLDEPSLGLAPKIIGQIFEVLDSLRDEGVTIVLVEQDAKLALKHSDRGYVMRTGTIALEGAASELLADDSVRTIYLGAWEGEGRA